MRKSLLLIAVATAITACGPEKVSFDTLESAC